jgi:hypothetical protein
MFLGRFKSDWMHKGDTGRCNAALYCCQVVQIRGFWLDCPED